MAFNPLNTFHKNKRFWMAAILLICMISFVFCGFKGDFGEKLSAWVSGRGTGPAIVTIDGRSVSDKDLGDLKMQRNLANAFMRNCAEISRKNLAKIFFDERKVTPDKETDARRQQLTLLARIQGAFDERLARPRYFDSGVKFDDLIAFKLWQAEADRLGIRVEKAHIDLMFNMEFFGLNNMQYYLPPREINSAQMSARRDIHRDATDAYIHRAIGEEFRVRIAQYVLLKSQPYSYLARRQQNAARGDFSFKFPEPSIPDETRSPLTMVQLYDLYRSKCAEFEVKLLPINVEDFIASVKEEPTESDKREFFDSRKGKPYDPSSDMSGIEAPSTAKIEFVYADPKSPFYLGKAKLISALERTNSFAFDAGLSPLGAFTRFIAIDLGYDSRLQSQYDGLVSKDKVRQTDRYRGAALYSDPDVAAPIMGYFAGQHDDLVAGLVCASALAPIDGLSSFLAQGATRHPEEVEAALRSETKRRALRYAGLFGSFMGSQNVIDMAGSIVTLDATTIYHSQARLRIARDLARHGMQIPTEDWAYVHPHFTLETVRTKLQELIDENRAEKWAQENMVALRDELQKNNDDPGKYRRVLNQQHIKDMRLTFGPAADKRNRYYNRFDIGDAEEFKVLKDSYLKYLDTINFFEGRDLTPTELLKPGDFPKMFFDPAESFSVGRSKYRAMPWPPEVKAKSRTTQVDSRLFNQENLAEADIRRFQNHLKDNDPNREPPKLDLFRTAARPILFWRTAEIGANRPGSYDQIGREIEETKAELAKINAELKDKKEKSEKSYLLQSKKVEKEQALADLKMIEDRIVQGWKVEQARKAALPEAKKAAEKVLDYPGKLGVGMEKAAEQIKADLKQKDLALITLPKLSQLQPENFGRGRDYGPPQLKDERIMYPREDMMKQLLGLYDLSSEIKTVPAGQDPSSKEKIGDPALDAINKELFEKASKSAPGSRGVFVQILANKPRTVFYVVAVTQLPKADDIKFAEAMKGAMTPGLSPLAIADYDHFAERAQEEQARVFHREFMATLRARHKVEVVDDKAAKRFDEHVGEN